MTYFLTLSLDGIFTGAVYAIAASGLVLTYSTTRVFNIAHGAVGMLFAFVYWDFTIRQGVPVWLALILVLFVLAPLTGVFFQRVVVRGLGTAPVGVTLVVTVALLVGLIGIAQRIWSPETIAANLPPKKFFGDHLIHLGGVITTPQKLITIAVSVLVAGLLYVLLTRTRVGTAMRASVDNAELLGLYGGRAKVVSALAWAVGTSLGALAGILYSAGAPLEFYTLTLLVISAFGAAVFGKLTSLPLTFAGAMILGVGNSYLVGYLDKLPFSTQLNVIRPIVPEIMLFAILVLMPQAPLRIGQVKGLVSAPVPKLPKAVLWGGVYLGALVLYTNGKPDSSLLTIGSVIALGILMLSLVLLTGYGGYVSLAQFAFAGIGAIVYCKVDQPNLLGLGAVLLITGLAGAVVAIPVLRLTGLYLALATLAFGQVTDQVIFKASYAFKADNPLAAKRLNLFGHTFESARSTVLLMGVFFVLVALVVVGIRRGRLGRILIAMRDSQAACGTLGLDMRWFRVGVFAASASIAGLSGALLSVLRLTIGSSDFRYFNSLILLLVAGVWGVTTVTGAMIGGYFMQNLQSSSGVPFILIAVGAIALGRDPNGLVNRIFMIPRWIQGTLYPRLADRYPGMALRVQEYGFGNRADDELTEDDAQWTTDEEVDSDAAASR